MPYNNIELGEGGNMQLNTYIYVNKHFSSRTHQFHTFPTIFVKVTLSKFSVDKTFTINYSIKSQKNVSFCELTETFTIKSLLKCHKIS